MLPPPPVTGAALLWYLSGGWECFSSPVGWCRHPSFGSVAFVPLPLGGAAFLLLLCVGLFFTPSLMGGAVFLTPPRGQWCVPSSLFFGVVLLLFWKAAPPNWENKETEKIKGKTQVVRYTVTRSKFYLVGGS